MTLLHLLLVAICATAVSNGLYFHLGESERKCFLEEVPDMTMIVGVYKVEVFDPQRNQYVATQPGFGMHVEVKDPNDEIVLSRTYAAEGRYTFTTHTAGEHMMCLFTNTTAWFGRGKLRIHLDIQIADHAIDYNQLGAKEKLSELQLRVRQLIDQSETIQKEQNYQRTREERFRATSESTNQRVLYWALSQIAVLVITGVWQLRHLKSFFMQKKLV